MIGNLHPLTADVDYRIGIVKLISAFGQQVITKLANVSCKLISSGMMYEPCIISVAVADDMASRSAFLFSLSEYRTLISVPLQSLLVSQITLDGTGVERYLEGGARRAGGVKHVRTLNLGADLKHEYMGVSPEHETETEEGIKSHVNMPHEKNMLSLTCSEEFIFELDDSLSRNESKRDSDKMNGACLTSKLVDLIRNIMTIVD